VRIFFGVFPPPQIAQAIVAMRDRAQKAMGGEHAKWEADEKLHLTLQFLGEETEERAARALELARTVHHAPFSLTVGGFGVFPNASRPHVLWLGVQGDVAPLANALGAALATEGFLIETRAYHPHVTIARLRGRRLPELPELPPTEPVTVVRFALIESRQGGYHSLGEITLG
jgi:2'-5' RNA ligase